MIDYDDDLLFIQTSFTHNQDGTSEFKFKGTAHGAAVPQDAPGDAVVPVPQAVPDDGLIALPQVAPIIDEILQQD